MPEELKGYHPLWINAYFLGKAEFIDGKLYIGDCSFSLLYVDVKYLDKDALDIILKLAEHGFPVCIANNPEQAGRNKSPDFYLKLKKMMSMPNVSPVLSGIAISKPLVKGTDLPDFWCRKTENKYYIFFANPCAQNLKLPLEYDQASDCQSMMNHIIVNIDQRETGITLDFIDNQSLLLVFDNDGNYWFEDISFNVVQF